MSEFDAYNCDYTSEEEYESDFNTNYPLTWELDHLTDVNNPNYNVEYVSPIRKARVMHQPPNAPRKRKKNTVEDGSRSMWSELKARNKDRYNASKKKTSARQRWLRDMMSTLPEPDAVRKMSTQTTLNFKSVKNKMD